MDINNYLDTFFKGTKDPSLDAMKYFMEEFKHPEGRLKFIHIAGTNGKGSCTEMMSNILVKAGYKVGKFLSPHLIKYNERISINGNCITDSEMEELIKLIQPKIEKYNVDIYKFNDCFYKTDYKELKIRLDNINALYDNIKKQEEKINSIHNDIITKNTAIINNELAAYFNQKVNNLEKNLKKFSKFFIIMTIIDIIIIIGLFCLNIFLQQLKNENIFFDIRLSIFSIGIIGLLWITKYFNRRTHETVQLIEDYEHKSLVLSSFLSYSKELEKLSEADKQFLLDYISKVSSTINKSPASNLNKRKSRQYAYWRFNRIVKPFKRFSKQ